MIKKSARKLDRRIKSKEGKSTATSRKLAKLLKENEPAPAPPIPTLDDVLAPLYMAPFIALPDTFECPESSNIWGAGYNPETKRMQVIFKSGKDSGPRSCYEYNLEGIIQLPEALWQDFKAAESKGKFFAASIRTKLQVRQLWVIQ